MQNLDQFSAEHIDDVQIGNIQGAELPGKINIGVPKIISSFADLSVRLR